MLPPSSPSRRTPRSVSRNLAAIVDLGVRKLRRAHLITTGCLLLLILECVYMATQCVARHTLAEGVMFRANEVARGLAESSGTPSKAAMANLRSLTEQAGQLVAQNRDSERSLVIWLVIIGLLLVIKGPVLTRYLIEPLRKAAKMERSSFDQERERRLVEARERELRLKNRELERLAGTDPLTGLPNRRALVTGLRQEAERLGQSNKPMGVLMIDIDHFKGLNDDYGHALGDEALRMVAETIQQNIRTTDLAARYGGEEFVVLLPGANVVDTAEVAEVIREAIASAVWDAGTLRVSVGAVSGIPEFDGDGLIRAADRAMYDAKRGGRNRTVVGDVNSRSSITTSFRN